MTCRCCGASTAMRRSPRRSFLQRSLYPLLGLYPWECGFCREERLYRARYTNTGRVRRSPTAKAESRAGHARVAEQLPDGDLARLPLEDPVIS
jgi:hypothetical protein